MIYSVYHIDRCGAIWYTLKKVTILQIEVNILQNNDIFASELSTTRHYFQNYHFCRGNSSKRKTRIGLILNGSGTYIYLNQKLKVSKGDVVFIPENVYCYSEWYGEPDIEVVYISCFLHYESFKYGAQVVATDEDIKTDILQISHLLSKDFEAKLEAYAQFYRLLKIIVKQLKPSDFVIDTTLQTAIEYITGNWDKNIFVADIARHCCVSESTMYHLFQQNLGQTPIRFINSIRINKIAITLSQKSAIWWASIRKITSEKYFSISQA